MDKEHQMSEQHTLYSECTGMRKVSPSTLPTYSLGAVFIDTLIHKLIGKYYCLVAGTVTLLIS